MKIKITILFFVVIGFLTGINAVPVRTLQDHGFHSIWYDLEKRAGSKEVIFDFYRTICNQLAGTENKKIPGKQDNVLRIATYNVHFWQNPWDYDWNIKPKKSSFENILKVIKLVNADILILQEVGNREHKMDLKELKDLGYIYSLYGNTGPLYNCIFSKLPFVSTNIVTYVTNPIDRDEKRCFVRAEFALPNKKNLTVYGTHLEVRDIKIAAAEEKPIGYGNIPEVKDASIKIMDEEDAREAQLRELLEYVKKHDSQNDVVIGMDSNSIRKKDLLEIFNNKTMWDLQSDRIKKEFGKTISSKTLDFITSEGWQESFEKGEISAPKFTSAFGTRVDFFFLNPTWSLPIAGCYIFYSWASDHCPVIMDINLTNIKKEVAVSQGARRRVDDITTKLKENGLEKFIPQILADITIKTGVEAISKAVALKRAEEVARRRVEKPRRGEEGIIKSGDFLRIKNVRTGEYLTVVDGGIFARKQPSNESVFKIVIDPNGLVKLMTSDGRYIGRSDDTYVIYAGKRHLLGINQKNPSRFKIVPSHKYGEVIELQEENRNVRMNVDIYTHPKGREVFFAGDDWRMTLLAKKWTKEFVLEFVRG